MNQKTPLPRFLNARFAGAVNLSELQSGNPTASESERKWMKKKPKWDKIQNPDYAKAVLNLIEDILKYQPVIGYPILKEEIKHHRITLTFRPQGTDSKCKV